MDTDLVLEYEGFIRQLAVRLVRGQSGTLLEDVTSVIRLRYLEALRTHNPNRAKLSTYATRYAIHEARRFIDGEHRHGMYIPVRLRATEPIRAMLSIESRPDDGELDAPEREQISYVNPDVFWDCIQGMLNPDEWLLIDMRFRLGMTWVECGDVLGISYESARQRVESIMPKLAARMSKIEMS